MFVKENFIKKVSLANFSQLPISDYSKVYLKNIQSQINYIADIYSSIVLKALEQATKDISAICVVDYGGGTGLLSVFAKMCGFSKVIYNDIYEISCQDVVHITQMLGIKLDEIIQGDIKNVAEISGNKTDLLISMDVIEHIYDLENFFSVANKMNPRLVMVHYTGANMYNPLINQRLKKEQLKVEYKGIAKKYGHKERDTINPFFTIRKEIIQQQFPEVKESELDNYAKLTRGLDKNDIITEVREKIKNPFFQIKIVKHPTNTCDPYTGNWEEHLISKKEYKDLAEKNGFSFRMIPSLYNTHQRTLKIFIFHILNLVTKIFKGVWSAPGFYLIFKQKNK